MAISPCYPTDFSALMNRRGAPRSAERVAIVVGNSDRAGQYTGLVAVDGKVVVHTDLDELGVAWFLAEALTRVVTRWPKAHVQSVVEIGGRHPTGVIVPCPPPPPPVRVLDRAMTSVFDVAARELRGAFPSRGPRPRGNGRKVAGPAIKGN